MVMTLSFHDKITSSILVKDNYTDMRKVLLNVLLGYSQVRKGNCFWYNHSKVRILLSQNKLWYLKV